jgi:hypothetical protein
LKTQLVLRIAVLAVLVGVAVPAFGAGPATAAKPCWMRVIDDWWDGRIDGIYSVACMRAAIKNAPEDLRQYGDLKSDITRRLAEGDKVKVGKQVYVADSGSTGQTKSQNERKSQDVVPAAKDNDPGDGDGPVQRAIKSGSDSPSSVPIPLIALGSLALLLLASGATGLVARRVRAHRAAGGPPDSTA